MAKWFNILKWIFFPISTFDIIDEINLAKIYQWIDKENIYSAIHQRFEVVCQIFNTWKIIYINVRVWWGISGIRRICELLSALMTQLTWPWDNSWMVSIKFPGSMKISVFFSKVFLFLPVIAWKIKKILQNFFLDPQNMMLKIRLILQKYTFLPTELESHFHYETRNLQDHVIWVNRA